jgi:predicted ester cyclase
MGHTELELNNIEIVKEFMLITYDPKRAGAGAIKHLCAPYSRFIAPTTFPDVHTVEQYAEAHGKLMRQINDLRIINFDVFFAKDNRVCLRYSAEGSHRGEPHGALQPTGRTAQWNAAAIFRLENGKIAEFIMNWNKLPMWEQLGWPTEECLVFPKQKQSELPLPKAA